MNNYFARAQAVLKCRIISRSNDKSIEDGMRMRTQTFLLISIPVCLVLALVATSVSYFYFERSFFIDGSVLYRGWPLCWMIELWKLGGRPPHGRISMFQPLNFAIDVAFWMIVFQTSVLLYVYLRKHAHS